MRKPRRWAGNRVRKATETREDGAAGRVVAQGDPGGWVSALVELLREIGSRHNVGPGVVAIAWTLHHPAITAAIVGGRSPEQVEGVAPAVHFRLNDERFEQISQFLTANAA